MRKFGIKPVAVTAATLVFIPLSANASAALALGPASAQAHSSSITCGATITSDTKLASDLLNCPNNGIVIGANNVTLNLNGHTIDGNATPVSSCPPNAVCDVGVVNDAGYDRVTVEGGTVSQFGLGVLVIGSATHNRLRGLAVARNTDFGTIFADSDHATITQNSFPHDGISGLLLINSRRSRVVDNAISGATGYGMYMNGVDNSQITANVLRGDQHGFLLGDNSSRNTLRENVVAHSGGGFDIGGVDVVANRIVRNRLIDDGDGILAGGRNTVVEHNRVTGTGFGFSDTGGFGILLDGTIGASVRSNQVTGGRGPAIWVTTLESSNAAKNNVISRNVTNSRLDDGIRVDQGATGTVLSRNTTNHNGDDGIDIDVPDTTVTRNMANFNADLGIEAVPGVTDAGGNKAIGNGNPAQCLNVVCK